MGINMILRSELNELLNGFEKRMKFINIVRCLINYKYTDQIRSMFLDQRGVLDNLILGVMVFIKERTLGEDKTCTVADIEKFLDELSAVIPHDDTFDSKILARYIMVDILQNGGAITEFLTYYSGKEAFCSMPIRLINEEKGSYHLTDDAFDFLFRSKEIESELDYSVTRFRMKEYMKRDNYSEALGQSRELVSRIRNIKTGMNDFLLRCRENIARISIDEYEKLISRVRELLNSEYNELADIQKNAEERSNKLADVAGSGIDAETTAKHRTALREIIANIQTTINEQRSLINQKTSLADSYRELLRDSYMINSYERMSFEKDLLVPLKKMNSLGDIAKYILFPLTKPVFENQFSIENFYSPQGRITDKADDEGEDLTEDDSTNQDKIQTRNTRYSEICKSFFAYAHDKNSFSIEDFIGSLRVSEIMSFCVENALPAVLLTMYGMCELDIDEWRSSDDVGIPPMGEFELAFCLKETPPEYLMLKKIKFINTYHDFSFEVKKDGQSRRIDMTNFCVEVIK